MIPTNTLRLWMPCDGSQVSAANPYGFWPHILSMGWDGAMAYAPPGLASLDETIAAGYPFCLGWIHGQFGAGKEPTSGASVGDLDGTGASTPVKCTPRGPEWLPQLEHVLPGLVKATAKRAAATHAKGGRAAIYTGCLSMTVLTQTMTAAVRNAKLDGLIAPWRDAGIDLWMLDMAGALDPLSGAATIDTMYFAERCLHWGIGVTVEPHMQVHPRLARWYDGRFSAVSMHGPTPAAGWHPAGPCWHNAVNGKGWHGPGMLYTLKEHFCWLNGAVKAEDRVALIPPATVNGSKCTAIMEMGDLPREWLGLKAEAT